MTATTTAEPVALSMLETQILMVLRHGALHGYGVALEIQRRDPTGPRVYPTNLYRRLHDLADRGLLRNTGIELDARGRARKAFAITDAGRRALADQTERLAAFVEDLRAAEGSSE